MLVQLFLLEDFFKVFDSIIEVRHPSLGSTSFYEGTGQDFVVKVFVTFQLFRLHAFDLFDNFTAVLDTGGETTEHDEACGSIKFTHQEIWV